MVQRTKPKLWKKVVSEVKRGSKGGKPGQWSARKAQLAVSIYKKRGGGYKGKKSRSNSLTKWTREDWGTKSGRPSIQGPRATGERYLPRKARRSLTKKEYSRTTRAKRRSLKKGKQYSRQPRDIASKTRKYRSKKAKRSKRRRRSKKRRSKVKAKRKFGANWSHTQALIRAAKQGDLAKVDNLIKRGPSGQSKYNDAMVYAAKGGHRYIVEWMLELGATRYNRAMIFAAQGGHRDIVERMLELGSETMTPDDYDNAMAGAAAGGYRDIVERMIELGANDYDNAMTFAAAGGHRDIVERMIELGATRRGYNRAIEHAISGGHRDIVELLLEAGATSYDRAMSYAAEKGHRDIVKFLKDVKAAGGYPMYKWSKYHPDKQRARWVEEQWSEVPGYQRLSGMHPQGLIGRYMFG